MFALERPQTAHVRPFLKARGDRRAGAALAGVGVLAGCGAEVNLAWFLNHPSHVAGLGEGGGRFHWITPEQFEQRLALAGLGPLHLRWRSWSLALAASSSNCNRFPRFCS